MGRSTGRSSTSSPPEPAFLHTSLLSASLVWLASHKSNKGRPLAEHFFFFFFLNRRPNRLPHGKRQLVAGVFPPGEDYKPLHWNSTWLRPGSLRRVWTPARWRQPLQLIPTTSRTKCTASRRVPSSATSKASDLLTSAPCRSSTLSEGSRHHHWAGMKALRCRRQSAREFQWTMGGEGGAHPSSRARHRRQPQASTPAHRRLARSARRCGPG